MKSQVKYLFSEYINFFGFFCLVFLGCFLFLNYATIAIDTIIN